MKSQSLGQAIFNIANWHRAAVFFCVLAALHCGGADSLFAPLVATPVQLSLSPSNPQIAQGTAQQFMVRGLDQSGHHRDLTGAVAFSVSAPDGSWLPVPSHGLLQLEEPGRYVVTADYHGSTVTTNITVTTAKLVSLSLSPATPQLPKGLSLPFTATAHFSDGTTQDVTALAAWSEKDLVGSGIARVSTKGIATAANVGQASITVHYKTLQAATTLKVIAASLTALTMSPKNPTLALGSSLTFSAQGTFSDGTVQDVTAAASWAVTDLIGSGVASIAGSTVTADSAGQATVSVFYQGLQADTTLTVTVVKLVSLALKPLNPSVKKGATLQFTATGSYSDGTTQDLTKMVSWTASDIAPGMGVASISASGLATANQPGQATIRASYLALSASTTLSVDTFSLVVHCQWPAAGAMPVARDVVMTPVVIDLDLDGQPEIVFAPQNGSGPMRLVAIHGKDCSQIYDVAANLQGFSQIAAADLDGDKYPEIVGLLDNGMSGGGHAVAVFDGRTGKLLAQSTDTAQMTGASYDCSGPAIADLTKDGVNDIVVGGLAVTWNKAMGRLDTLWNHSVQGASWGTMSLVNDMDGDGLPEVVTGNLILNGRTGADKTPSVMSGLTTGSYPAVGDFNGDGAPDLVLVQSASLDEHVAVVDVKNNAFLMGPIAIPNGWGGPPTVADFDGDGTPDFGTAGPRNYTVFSLDCLKTPKPAKCHGTIPGVLWQSQTKDISSGGTASAAFDPSGDGHAKVVYRDECWLRVYDGLDGTTLFAQAITSGTALELPVIADADKDGHADIIVSSDSIMGSSYCTDQSPEPATGLPHTGATQGVFVLRDPLMRWAPSRPLWNQHTYHITNINDDLSIPAPEPPNWTSHNNYRQN